MFNKILIANRGEIARRIIKSAKKMGLMTVAVYSEIDSSAPFVKEADEAIALGGKTSSESYLNIEAIIKAAQETKAEAIHPGYGFLSENPLFAKACENHGLIFIGPSIKALEIMGSKKWAKEILENSAVPLTPGYHGQHQDAKHLETAAQKIGFPVLIKAANGGGGKGMRAVYEACEFNTALEGAKREAKAYFADDTVILEKLVLNPRHIEIQILADHHGHILHLFERDCSIQRRHQKIIEEAPAGFLSDSLREKLHKAAIEVAKIIDYRGAGTVEFLVSGDDFYFMEMNTRLQVEHPVTEMITGLDLVELQISIAANEKLTLLQQDIVPKGHAIECRIYAEDPFNNFLPSIGQVEFLDAPKGDGIRIDSGIEINSVVSQYYDPMISKLITYGQNREEAISRMTQALGHYNIGGIQTNIRFLNAIINAPDFIKNNFSTTFLDQFSYEEANHSHTLSLILAASIDYAKLVKNTQDPLMQSCFGFSLLGQTGWRWRYHLGQITYDVEVCQTELQRFELHIENQTYQITYHVENGYLSLCIAGKTNHYRFYEKNHTLSVFIEGQWIEVERYNLSNLIHENAGLNANLKAPMPATVVAILKHKGESVKSGDKLMILEAMKMEHTMTAPKDGVIEEIFFEVGAQVSEGTELLKLESVMED